MGYSLLGCKSWTERLNNISACKLNKQDDNKEPCHTPFPILSQLVVGLGVVGGKLVINLLPFTSGRIDSEETKRKTRRGKPRVSDHLGKLKETRLSHA